MIFGQGMCVAADRFFAGTLFVPKLTWTRVIKKQELTFLDHPVYYRYYSCICGRFRVERILFSPLWIRVTSCWVVDGRALRFGKYTYERKKYEEKKYQCGRGTAVRMYKTVCVTIEIRRRVRFESHTSVRATRRIKRRHLITIRIYIMNIMNERDDIENMIYEPTRSAILASDRFFVFHSKSLVNLFIV